MCSAGSSRRLSRWILDINVTFTPTLTLQLFAQPFIASGSYTSFKEFAEVKSRNDDLLRKATTEAASLRTRAQDRERSGYNVDPDGAGPAAPFTFR